MNRRGFLKRCLAAAMIATGTRLGMLEAAEPVEWNPRAFQELLEHAIDSAYKEMWEALHTDMFFGPTPLIQTGAIYETPPKERPEAHQAEEVPRAPNRQVHAVHQSGQAAPAQAQPSGPWQSRHARMRILE